MNALAIFCPACDALIRAAPTCPACGWQRPTAAGPVGQPLHPPLALGADRTPLGRAVVAGGRLWLAFRRGAHSELLAVDPTAPALETFPLPPGALPTGLGSDGQRLFVPLESREHGPPQPLLALSGVDGREVWRFGPGDAVLSPPAVAGGQVALTGVQWAAHGDLYRAYLLDAANGEPLWPPVTLPAAAERAAPALGGPWLLVPGGRHLTRPGPLLALERASGRLAWRCDEGEPYTHTPALDGDRTYALAGRRRDRLLALDLTDGRRLWQVPAPRVTSKGGFTAPPVVAGARLLLPAGDFQGGNLLQLTGFPRPAKGGVGAASAERDFAGEKPGYALLALACADGAIRWRCALRRHLVYPPAVAGETVILGDGEGRLLALDLESGERRWAAELDEPPAVPPLIHGPAVYVLSRGGWLYAIRWTAGPQPPAEPAAAYEARGEWRTAGVAHALAGDPASDRAAGRCFLRVGEAAHALALFQAAGDKAGQAQALEALGRRDEALTLYRRLGDRGTLAGALLRAGRPGEAAPLLAELGRDLEAARAYEEAGDAASALARYLAAEAPDEALRLVRAGGDRAAGAATLAQTGHPGLAADLYREMGRPELAAPLYARAGRRSEAEDCYREAVARFEQQGLDEQVGRLLRDWALAEIEQRGAAAQGDKALADRLAEAARRLDLAAQAEAADACREEAARVMGTPRFHLRITAAEGEGFVRGESTPVRVELRNVGYGPAGQVQLRLSGDLEEPYPEQTFARLRPDEACEWETGIAPCRVGKGVRIVVQVTYRALRGGQPGTARFEHLIEVQRSGLMGVLLGGEKAPVQLTIDKVIAPGATSSELTIQDSAVVARSPLLPQGTGGGERTTRIEDAVLIGQGRQGPARFCARCGVSLPAGEREHCPHCGVPLCPRCGQPRPEDARLCETCRQDLAGLQDKLAGQPLPFEGSREPS